MYSLEERIYFDGAAAAAVTNTDNTDSSSTPSNSNDPQTADGSSPDAGAPSSNNNSAADSGTSKDTSSAPVTDTSSDAKPPESSVEASSGKIDIDALLKTILDSDANHADNTHTTLVVSTAVENASEIAKKAQEHNITVVTYDPNTESLQQLFHDIQNALNGEKASSINFVTKDNSAAGFSLISASTISAENITIDNNVSSFMKETASLLTDGGRITVSGDSSLTDSSFNALESAMADAAGVKVSFIDSSNGEITTTAPDAMDYNIIFVDSSVPGTEDLLKNLSPNTEVYFLNKDSDGVSQISNYLDGKFNVDSIQIIAHGNDGEILLGQTLLSNDNISDYSAALQNWGKSLNADGDILIYSCNTAEYDAGKDFTNEIARLTGADISVSTDGTGGPSGNWTLEYSTGSIESAQAFDTHDYQYHLGVQWVLNSANNATQTNSLPWAVNAAVAGDIIYFKIDATHPAYAINLTTSSIIVNKAITIDGTDASKVTISSTNAGFLISASATVKNITFSNINFTGVGAAVEITDGNTVTLENLVFNNCYATDKGGAVYIYTSASTTIVNITNSTFEKCHAGNSGGAIYIGGSGTDSTTAITLTNCVFGRSSDTKAAHTYSNYSLSGGAIYLEDGTLDIDTCKFYYNYASTGSGGAIYIKDSTASLDIYDNSVFTGNFASAGSGGAIYNSSGTATISSSTFTDNTASASGGAIYNSSGTINLSSSTFTSNTASVNGGAIYNYEYLNLSSGTLSFTGNSAGTNGNAIYNNWIMYALGGVEVKDTTASPNQQIYNNLTFSLTGNATLTNFAVLSSGLSIGANTLTLNNSSISGTITGTSSSSLNLTGGTSTTAVSMTLPTVSGSLQNLTIGSYTSVKFSSDLTIGSNGSVTLGTSSNLYLNGYTLSSTVSAASIMTVTGSSAASSYIYGGADSFTTGAGRISIYGGSDSVRSTISNLTFTNSTNSAVRVNAMTYANITNCTFTANSASNGGAINVGGTGDLTLSASTFTTNTGTNGGAIYNFGALTITGTNTFTSNSATNGGAIYNAVTMTLSGGTITFLNNTAVTNGDNIYNASTLNVSGDVIVKDTSATAGEIYTTSGHTISLAANATFTHFTITNAGTAALVIGANTLTLDNSSVTGAMTTTDQSTLSLVNVASYTLTGNMTLKTLNIANGTLNLATYNLTIANSITGTASTVATSIISGTGQVQITAGTALAPITIGNVTMTSSVGQAKLSIGAAAYVEISNSVFSSNANAVTNNGGAIYNAGTLTLASGNVDFNGNTATNGNAIYNNGTLNFKGGVNVRDTAAVATQAIYNVNTKAMALTGDATLTKFSILNNNGGTFTIGANTTLTLDNTTITGTLTGGAAASLAIAGSSSFTLPNAITLYNLTLGDTSKLYLNGYTLTLKHSATGNTAATSIIYGGVDAATPGEGIIVVNGGSAASRISISNLTFTNASNSAVQTDASSFVSIADSVFSANNKTKADAQYGGAIFNYGNLTVSNTSFLTNSVEAANPADGLVRGGGAIYNDFAGTLTLTNNCIFTSNYVEGNISTGGAIENMGNLSITGSTFTKNTAPYAGGAICILDGASVSISNSNFGDLADINSGNTVTSGGGGAIYNFNDIAVPVTISACNFYYNQTAAANGGAIYNSGTLVLTGSSDINFKDNVSAANGNAIYNNATLNATGGVTVKDISDAPAKIYNAAGKTLSLTGNATFTHFAITNAGTFSINAYNLTLDNTSVSGTIVGGATSTLTLKDTSYTLLANMSLQTLNLNNATLTLNSNDLTIATSIRGTIAASSIITANGNDGQVLISTGSAETPVIIDYVKMTGSVGNEILHINATGNVSIANSIFTANSNDNGGSIENEGSLGISSSTFTNNTVTGNGGAIYNTATGTLILASGNIDFSGNTATNGNAIYNNGTLYATGNVNVRETSNVPAEQQIFNFTGKTISLTGNATFTNLTVENNGTFSIGANTLTLDNTTISNSLTGSTASTLTLANGTTFSLQDDLTLYTLNIGNANATLGLNNHTLTIVNSISGSTAATSNVSGAGQVQISSGTIANPVTISNVTMKNGHTILLVNGGANVAISSSTFNNNTSAANAGAISSAGALSLTNCSFTSNTAAALGGAIYSSGGSVTISGTGSINGNLAPSGSFIYLGDSAQLILSGWTGNSTDAETIYIKDGSSGMLVKGTNTLTNFAVTLCEDLSFNNAGASSLTLGAGSSFANGTTGNISGDANDSLSFTYTAGVNSVLSGTIGSLTVDGDGNAMSMPGNLTVYSALSLSNGSLAIGANTLSLGGTVTGNITGGNTSSIAFVGTGSTTVLPTITNGLANLIMNGAGGKMTLGADLKISNQLVLNNGYLDIANYDLTLETDATIGGTPSASSFVMTSGTGDFIKNFDIDNQIFTFALGNYSSGSYYYTPITVSFTEATYGANSYVTAHLYNTKEPNVTENAYITRYWTIGSNAITEFNAEIEAQYAANDVVTSEAVLNGMLYIPPTDPPPLEPELSGWVTLGGVNTSTHTFTGTGITKFGNFTAYGHYTPPVSHNSTTNSVPPQNNDQQQQADPWLNDATKNNNTPSLFAEAQAMMPTSITLSDSVFMNNSWNSLSSSLISTAYGLSNGEAGANVFSPFETTLRNPIILDNSDEFILSATGTDDNMDIAGGHDYSSMSLWASRYEKHSLFKTNVDNLLDSLITNIS